MAENRLPFRPLDNSSTTRLSYGLEANHWINALNSAQASTNSTVGTIPMIGAIITIFVSLIFIILSLLILLLQWIIGSKNQRNEPISMTEQNLPTEPVDKSFFHSW